MYVHTIDDSSSVKKLNNWTVKYFTNDFIKRYLDSTAPEFNLFIINSDLMLTLTLQYKLIRPGKTLFIKN